MPVVPGAHYACGGVLADLQGRTGVPGLSAVGEVAATGVHGANRLASNSLVEGLVAGGRTGARLARASRTAASGTGSASPGWVYVAPGTRAATATAMSLSAGVLRSGPGLAGLLDRLEPGTSRHTAPGSVGTLADVEAAELALVSRLVATAALRREESRGCHRRADAPATRPGWARRQVLRLCGDALTVDDERRVA